MALLRGVLYATGEFPLVGAPRMARWTGPGTESPIATQRSSSWYRMTYGMALSS